MKEKFDKRIIQTVSFFLYSGYYVGLSALFASGLSNFSKFYSIPIRILLLLLMLFYLKNKFSFSNNKWEIILCSSFTLLYILKVLYTENIDAELSRSWLEYVFYLISYCVIPFIFFMNVDLKKHKVDIINSIIISGVIVSIFNIFLFKDLLLSGGIGRISDITRNTEEAVISPLALAYSSAITISLIIYKLVYERLTILKKLLLLGGMLLSSVIFFMGSTRGALLAIFLSVLVIFFLGNVKKKIYILIILAVNIPIFIVIAEFTGSSLFERTSSAINDGDTSGRESLWNAALEEFYRYPLFGGRIEVSGIYPHNFILEILMATGIIGFFIFLILFLISVASGIKAVKLDKFYIVPFILLGCSISQNLVSGSIVSSIVLFSSLAMMNSLKKNKR